MRNSAGRPDGLWTLTVIAFMMTTAAYAVSMFNVITLGDLMISFTPFDGMGYAAIVLVPLITGYFGRRYTKATNATAISQATIYAAIGKSKANGVSQPGPTSQPEDEV